MKAIWTSGLVLILSIAALAVPSNAYAQGGSLERVLVHVKPGYRAEFVTAAEHQGGQVHFEFDELNTIAVSLPANALEGFRHNPNVVLVEKDEPRYLTDQVVPYGVTQVEALDVWDSDHDGQIDPQMPNGSGRLICVIDSGVYAGHEDLIGVNFAGGYPSDWNVDDCGHGTHVVGTIAAMNNAVGVVGASPGTVSLYIVKVYGTNCNWTYSSTLVNAAYRCRNAGANIINMSLAGTQFSSFEDSAFQALYDQGILSIAAAGNRGDTSYAYPASYNSVISVGAVDQNNIVASFSQRNDKIELVAPGVSVLSTRKDGGYSYMSGTSTSTPHVSGVAAVVWSSAPSKKNWEVRAILQQTAQDLGAPGRDNQYGYGLIKTKAAYYSLAQAPTAAEITALEAVPEAASIRVDWQTTSELDIVGFNVYRSESPEAFLTPLNGDLIPGQVPGSLMGATYEFVDETAKPGLAYYYWVESIDVYGLSASHGPVSAEITSLRRLLPAHHRFPPLPLTLRGD
jgi:subtilisin family serine protease